ncbi:hypothetical protein QJQ45_023789 [Haematococcus lacustris]|nr:hypothetical protein QJQ45_023789 [Haematococcus lacustris]
MCFLGSDLTSAGFCALRYVWFGPWPLLREFPYKSAKPAPQPGRWLDRDCNAALNMQRIGESRWRPLELCYWPDQGALPAKGKEYPGLGYKRLRDKPPKAQKQRQQPAVELAAGAGAAPGLPPPPAAPPWQQQAAGAGAAPGLPTPPAEQQGVRAELDTSSTRKRRAGGRDRTQQVEQDLLLGNIRSSHQQLLELAELQSAARDPKNISRAALIRLLVLSAVLLCCVESLTRALREMLARPSLRFDTRSWHRAEADAAVANSFALCRGPSRHVRSLAPRSLSSCLLSARVPAMSEREPMFSVNVGGWAWTWPSLPVEALFEGALFVRALASVLGVIIGGLCSTVAHIPRILTLVLMALAGHFTNRINPSCIEKVTARLKTHRVMAKKMRKGTAKQKQGPTKKLKGPRILHPLPPPTSAMAAPSPDDPNALGSDGLPKFAHTTTQTLEGRKALSFRHAGAWSGQPGARSLELDVVVLCCVLLGYSPAQPSPAQPSPAQPSPAQPSPAQPSPAQPSPAQPSPAQPSHGALGIGHRHQGKVLSTAPISSPAEKSAAGSAGAAGLFTLLRSDPAISKAQQTSTVNKKTKDTEETEPTIIIWAYPTYEPNHLPHWQRFIPYTCTPVLTKWKELEALPTPGKEHQQCYKRVDDRLPKARQRLHQGCRAVMGDWVIM